VKAGVPLSTVIVESLFMGVLKGHGVTNWSPSRSFYRSFLHRIGLTRRAGTKAARSLPLNFEEVRALFFKRFAWFVDQYKIQKKNVFNCDESGVVFFPIDKKTYAPVGTTDAVLQAFDEKKQYTMTPVVNMSGELVTMQLIWQGATSRCEPHKDMQELHKDELTNTHTKSHWSRPHTMEAIIDDTYNAKIKAQDADRHPREGPTPWMMIWDVYCSHIDAKLLKSLKAKYPGLHILYIPPNCTSALQPLDVLYNGQLKCFLKSCSGKWLADHIAAQLQSGVPPEEVKVPRTKTELIGPFCDWMARGVKWL
jgi:hypothetical protein